MFASSLASLVGEDLQKEAKNGKASLTWPAVDPVWQSWRRTTAKRG